MAPKRKASQGLVSEQSKKPRTADFGNDAESLYSDQSSDLDSEEENNDRNADTPLTPFSPSRVQYPSQRKTIPCTVEGCEKLFNRPARLAAHLRAHTNDRSFVCSYEGCDKAYTESKHLKQHVKGAHTQEREYACNWEGCGKAFMTGTRLRRHKEAHEGHERFRCTGYAPCAQTFRKHQTLQRHIRSDHLFESAFPCTHVDPITNAKCKSGFDNGSALRKHEDRIHGKLHFFCDECTTPSLTVFGTPEPLGFKTKSELNKHIKTSHLNCLFCDVAFRTPQELERHSDTAHSKVSAAMTSVTTNRVACTMAGCGKTFTKKANLDAHIRTVHKGERFTCGITDLTGSTLVEGWSGDDACGRDFVAKVNLEDHVRTQHLGLSSVVNAKRIKGTTKSKKMSTKVEDEIDPVAMLTGTNYGKQRERNIPCTIAGCQWLFTRDYDLQQHIQSKHTTMEGEIDVAPNPALASMFDLSAGNPVHPPTNDQIDLDWEIQQQAFESGHFWFGADTGVNTPVGDSWLVEEDEMRRLIDDGSAELGFEHFVDPALTGL